MRVFITGAGGFIGRNACEYLGKRHKVFAPSHSELELNDAEAVLNYVQEHDIDVILHCANKGGGRGAVGLQSVVDDNLRSFFSIARASKEVSRIFYYGSGAEFDKSRDLKEVREDQFGERVPKDDYGFYKYVCNNHARASDNITNFFS